jgi:hypothetical protein
MRDLKLTNFKCVPKISKINTADKVSAFPKHGVESLIKFVTKPRYIVFTCVSYSSELLFVQSALFTEPHTQTHTQSNHALL